MISSYQNSFEHIIDELKIINILISNKISSIQKNNDPLNNDFSGLIISEYEVNKMLQYLSENKIISKIDSASDNTEYDLICKKTQAKINQTQKNGIQLTLLQIIENFSLSKFEKQIILFCLAPEIDRAYSTLYAYLHDNISKKKPSSSLILELTCNSIEEKMLCRRYFSKNSPLFKYGIIQNNSTNDENILSFDSLSINQNILNFLLDNRKYFKNESNWQLSFPDDLANTGNFLPEIKQKISKYILNNQRTDKIRNNMILLCGATGVGKKILVSSICHDFNCPLIVIDSSKIVGSEHFEHILRDIFLESILHNAVIYLDNFDLLYDDTQKAIRLLDLANNKNPLGIFFMGSTKNSFPDFLKSSSALMIPIPLPNYLERNEIWRKESGQIFSDEILSDLSNKFKFTRQQIFDAIEYAKNLSSLEDSHENSVSINSIYQACRIQSSENLSKLALKVNSPYSWEDLILPNEKKRQLFDVITYIKNKNRVYSEWGFGKKLSPNWGLNILFAGESGTGKTLAAQVIANELNLDMYRIDLSSIISKYIGETEKNLNKIFMEAQNSNSILFFDEADALFGKRSEVHDAHDRYANIEVGYLLQKLEMHQEVVILATNLPKNIDDAFLRRMQFWVEFPFPGYEQRLQIWQNAFPSVAPIDLTPQDFQFLAEKFHISGGSIKNIVLTAAFLASDGKKPISMQNIMHAIKREYEKIAKPCTKSEFGMYHELLKNTN